MQVSEFTDNSKNHILIFNIFYVIFGTLNTPGFFFPGLVRQNNSRILLLWIIRQDMIICNNISILKWTGGSPILDYFYQYQYADSIWIKIRTDCDFRLISVMSWGRWPVKNRKRHPTRWLFGNIPYIQRLHTNSRWQITKFYFLTLIIWVYQGHKLKLHSL